MGHVLGAGAGVGVLHLAVSLAMSSGRRHGQEHLAVLGALRGPATAEEAAGEHRTVERVLAIVRAQRAAAESGRASGGEP